MGLADFDNSEKCGMSNRVGGNMSRISMREKIRLHQIHVREFGLLYMGSSKSWKVFKQRI